MTQRIFDIENEKDYADLWGIVPDGVYKITQGAYSGVNTYWVSEKYTFDSTLIAINWHDAKEITRPVDYESMIGCVVYFYNEPEYKSLGILKEEIDGRTFIDELGGYWDYIEPAKKSELKFWGE